ncbi:MAG: cache domain-containing protein, partial [Paracraurococcus sp.]
MALSHPPLRVILAAGFGGIAMLAALGTSVLAGHEAARRLEASQHEALDAAAARLVDRLDRALSARWRDLRIVAGLPFMQDETAAPALRRSVLRQVHDSFPDYGLLALVAPDGRVVLDSREAIEGRAIANQAFLRAAMLGPVVEDVHEAGLLAGRPEEARPRQLLDLAAPVRDAAGQVTGIVVAQLDWRWIAALAGQTRPGEPEMLILARNRDVLLGPAPLLGRMLPELAPARGVAAFPDGAGFLAASRGMPADGSDPGPGWQVVARRPTRAALAPARALERNILAVGLGASLVTALFGWAAA